LHPPRLWPPYHPDYYATFFEDPDGFRLEVAASKDARLDKLTDCYKQGSKRLRSPIWRL